MHHGSYLKQHKTLLMLAAVFVVLVICTVLIKLNQTSSADELAADGTSGEQQFVPGQILVKFKSSATKEKKDKFIADYNLKKKSEISQIGLEVLELPGTGSEKEYEKTFKTHKDVEYASLDYKFQPTMIPNDPSYNLQWFLPKIAAPTAWDTTQGSASVIIAILDTGTDPTHPDLASKMLPGWNFYDNNSDTHDVYGHGSATAGDATALGNNGVGVSSPCPNCKLLPLRISGPDGWASSSDTVAALTYAADHGARIANISFGFAGSTVLDSAARYMQSKGGVVFVSAGNESSNIAYDNPYIMYVGATDSSDAKASFSNYGPGVDITSPGVSIYSTANGGGYRYASGTSMAAPVASGVAGLMLSANPSLSPSQLETMLEQSSDDLGTAGFDTTFGWGRVNAYKAVQAALAGPAPDTTPPSVNFVSPANGATVSNSISVTIDAKDNVGVSTVNLTVDGVDQGRPSSYSTSYSFQVNTNNLTNGSHSMIATARDTSGNEKSTSITVNVYNTPDTIAPTVSITSPTNGSTVNTKSINIAVSATDNVAVTKVEIYVDGVLLATDTSSPYQNTWNPRNVATGAHTIYAKAYDAKGNVGTSSTITVNKSSGGGGKPVKTPR